MKRKLLFTLFIVMSSYSYSQIKFEKGYIIYNTGEKELCLIKNVDWKNNPNRIKYKTAEDNKVKIATINDIKEFGIANFSKYIRSTVAIDRSTEDVNRMGEERKPIFKEETLFLKVLVDGNASLYEYIDKNLRRYFYNMRNLPIEQLVFKSYKKSESRVGRNERYKQQLFKNLKCPNISLKEIEKLDYRQKDLIDLFVKFNNCNKDKSIAYEGDGKRDLFNLYVKIGLKNSSLVMRNVLSDTYDLDFGNKLGVSFGIEAEYLLPFNKNRWGIVFQPTYQSYQSQKTTEVSNVVGGKLISSVNYRSIEFPIGIRYYIDLNNSSKLFFNTSLILEKSFNSIIKFDRVDGSNLNEISIKSDINYAFGLGYNYNKYSLEFRMQTQRNVSSEYVYLISDYKTASFVLGYNLF